MTMFNKDQIFQLLESRDGEALRALWRGRGAVDIAALLDSVEDSARQAAVFRTLPKGLAADVFSYLPGPTQARLARSSAFTAAVLALMDRSPLVVAVVRQRADCPFWAHFAGRSALLLSVTEASRDGLPGHLIRLLDKAVAS